jgi:hypothetical protein
LRFLDPASRKKQSPQELKRSRGLYLSNPGDFLLSHTVTRAVPSAPTGLTSVFGMGTGVTLSTKSPENLRFNPDKSGLNRTLFFVLRSLFAIASELINLRDRIKEQSTKLKVQKSNSGC